MARNDHAFTHFNQAALPVLHTVDRHQALKADAHQAIGRARDAADGALAEDVDAGCQKRECQRIAALGPVRLAVEGEG
ncbi:hypothetical protein ASD02_11200 [Ensifer sp. Root1252]|nr:hypothetical protein ASD02_11200 [Ensifer sp. Root1252]KRC74699.1 hypothetical protein ASE32_07285 [Ensifer sp. Root231]KRC94785.1 hypothetical protein ASE47_08275 [Ensifer sp. Root258]